MQKLISAELLELRPAWSNYLNETVASFDWDGAKTDEGNELIKAVAENINDAVFYVIVEEVISQRTPAFITSKVSGVIEDLTEDDGFVKDFIGSPEADPALEGVFYSYLEHVQNQLETMASGHWANIVKEAQQSIRVAAVANNAFGYVSSYCLDVSEFAVFLLERSDVAVELRWISKDNATISDTIVMLENSGKLEASFGTERFVYVVNGKFIQSDEDELEKDDVLIIYKVLKR